MTPLLLLFEEKYGKPYSKGLRVNSPRSAEASNARHNFCRKSASRQAGRIASRRHPFYTAAMKSILRFLVIMVFVFGAALLWKSDKRRAFSQPPRQETKIGVNPQEEVDRALRPLRAAPEVPAWSKDEFQGRLSDAFQRNDPCAVLGLLAEEASVAPQKFLTAGMEVLFRQQRGRHDLLEELFTREDSPLFGVPQEDSRRKETRFLNALVQSNQLTGYGEEEDVKNPHRDPEQAINTLRELIAEEPDNGAYQFFLAQALRQNGEKKTEVDRAYANAAEARRFDSFYQGVYDQLQNLAYDNLATFAWVYSYMHRAPVPDFNTAQRNLRYWASTNDTGKWIAGRLAKRLVSVGERYKATSPGYLYSQMEYLMGQNLKYTVEGRWEKKWEETAEKMRENRAFIAETPESVTNAELELYQGVLEGEARECNFATWQTLYDAYRAKGDKS
jgi:hypothetical protein